MGTIGLDNEIDRQAVSGPRLGRSDDRHQRSPGPDQTRGPLLDAATDDIENQIDCADVLQRVVAEVDGLLRARVVRLLAVGGETIADDATYAPNSCASCVAVDPDCAGRAVHAALCPA